MQQLTFITNLILLTALCLAQLTNCMRVKKWYQRHDVCINESAAPAAAAVLSKSSMIECCTAANNLIPGHSVAQLNTNTSQCSVYHYGSVCHILHSAPNQNNQSNSNSNHCSVFTTVPVKNITLLNEVQHKLKAAWVFGANGQENVSTVCSKWPQHWQPESVAWRQDGVELNGVNSSMILRDSDFGSFSPGLTLLLRLKRQPRHQIFMKNMPCNGSGGFTFWENDATGSGGKLRFNCAGQFNPSRKFISADVLSHDASQFINIGITAVPGSYSYSMFNDGSIIPMNQLQNGNNGAYNPNPVSDCFLLGHNLVTDSSNVFNGTVRAVAIANESMTEQEINTFFDMVDLMQGIE